MSNGSQNNQKENITKKSTLNNVNEASSNDSKISHAMNKTEDKQKDNDLIIFTNSDSNKCIIDIDSNPDYDCGSYGIVDTTKRNEFTGMDEGV